MRRPELTPARSPITPRPSRRRHPPKAHRWIEAKHLRRQRSFFLTRSLRWVTTTVMGAISDKRFTIVRLRESCSSVQWSLIWPGKASVRTCVRTSSQAVTGIRAAPIRYSWRSTERAADDSSTNARKDSEDTSQPYGSGSTADDRQGPAVGHGRVLSRADLVPCDGDENVGGVRAGRGGRGDLVAADADGDVAERAQGPDDLADAVAGGLLQVA